MRLWNFQGTNDARGRNSGGRWRVRLLAASVVVIALSPLGIAQAHADPVLGAAGDIACPASLAPSATQCQQKSTADEIAAAHPNAVAALGDDQYDSGSSSEFMSAGAFDATWGQFKPIIYPVPGNHEYGTPGAAGYFGYFGPAAGPDPQGYYSYDIGAWHLIALNSNCDDQACSNSKAGTVSAAEVNWLRADLAAHPGVCTLAYWHHPRFTSSGTVPNSVGVDPLWQVLYQAHADVILNGHDHSYERFAQQDPAQNPTSAGLREFVVGTGGEDLFSHGMSQSNSEKYDNTHFGVLFLTLHPTSYEWKFQATDGTTVDASNAAVPCHAGATINAPSNGSFSRSHEIPMSGTAQPGSTVTVYEGSTARGTVIAGADGRWSMTLAAVGDGSHSFTAIATDSANPTGPSSNVVSVTVDTIAPGAPAITFPAEGSRLTSHSLTVSGTAEPNSTVTVVDGIALQGVTTAAGSGVWSITLAGVPDGRHVYTAAASDAAGNTGSPSSPVHVTVNTLQLLDLAMTRTRFAVSGRRPRRPHGTVFRFTLSEAAAASIAIVQERAGRRFGARCVTPTRKLRHRRGCLRTVTLGSLSLSGRTGSNSLPFSGRLGRGALRPGRYQARVQASGAGGVSTVQTVSFTVIAG